MLLGRGAETELITRILARQGSVVVAGEPGIGKTALLREAASHSRRAAYKGGGLSTLSWMSYLPLARALHQRLPDDATGVLDLVEKTVGNGVLILDDLHWADDDTLALLPNLVTRITMVASSNTDAAGHVAVMRAAEAMGAHHLELGPLSIPAAAMLARHLSPGLRSDDATRLAERSGGHPLLLEAMLTQSDVPPRIREAIAARLAGVSSGGMRLLGLIALLGRPLALRCAGPYVDEVVAAGVGVERNGMVGLANVLVGEAVLACLPLPERCSLHSRLARLVSDPAEAARHHSAANEQAEAVAAALEAARSSSRSSERARHLALAAACSCGPEGDPLRLSAAACLLDVHEAEAAERLAASLEGDDANLRARSYLVRARARAVLGDPSGALAAAERGLAVGKGGELSVLVLLQMEIAALLAWPCWEPGRARQRTLEALGALRHHDPVMASEAAVLDARVAMIGGEPDWEDRCLLALRTAGAGSALSVGATVLLAAGQALGGHFDVARDLLDEALAAAEEGAGQALGAEIRLLRAVLVHSATGETTVVPELRRLLNDRRLIRYSDIINAHLALVLADEGRTGEALAALSGPEARPRSPVGAFMLHWARGEAELVAGRPRRARAHAEEARASGPASFPGLVLADLTEAWAAIALGEPVHRLVPPFPTLPPAAAELGALAAMAEGKAADAESLFSLAAEGWRATWRRAALRCAWAAGDLAAQIGATERACQRLATVEEEAAGLGHRPVVARARASMRRVGLRRPPRRAPGRGLLTGREREVLMLVGEGLTTGEIAQRLGVARSTVDTQVESGMRKLGARTRIQAAAMVSDDG